MADARTNLSGEVAGEVRRHLAEAVYETVIPRSVRLSEAPSHGLPIALYSPDSKGALAYARFAAEFRARLSASGRLDARTRVPGRLDSGLTPPVRSDESLGIGPGDESGSQAFAVVRP
jgi:hypothetical protein